MTTAAVDTKVAVARLIEFLETGQPSDGLFAPHVFLDLSLPLWRVQTNTAKDAIALRVGSHPSSGRVRVERLSQTDTGFAIEFEERWEHEGQDWYCREMIRADVVDDTIVEMAVYCTGDWDEAKQRDHARALSLLRP
jgi:hypothetical protein